MHVYNRVFHDWVPESVFDLKLSMFGFRCSADFASR